MSNSRKLWKSESGEVYSAESAAEAKRLRDRWNNWDPDGAEATEDRFDDEPLADDFELEVSTDGPVAETFAWAAAEPEAHVQNLGVFSRVCAKASVFARHEHGLVCGDDF